jgi:CBS-domain-containing membrane protein
METSTPAERSATRRDNNGLSSESYGMIHAVTTGMKVRDLMAHEVAACRPSDSANVAAHLMWERDCGCVPGVDRDNVVVGIVTDRDICMGAYTQGRSLHLIGVQDAMSRPVVSCEPDDDLITAEKLMRDNRVRRLPVCDADGKLMGVISLSDIALEAERERREDSGRLIRSTEVAQILGAVSQTRAHAVVSIPFAPEPGEMEFTPKPPIKRGQAYR